MEVSCSEAMHLVGEVHLFEEALLSDAVIHKVPPSSFAHALAILVAFLLGVPFRCFSVFLIS